MFISSMERAVPRKLESLAALVDFVREFLGAERMSSELAFDMDLVIEELFTNLVRHARGGGDIRVLLERGPGEVRIELRAAEASPFDPAAAPRVQVDLPLTERRAGGLGIHFVRELCKRFHYEWRDGVGTTTVVMGVTE
jgi:serine/threonine-protein kinase RsbW